MSEYILILIVPIIAGTLIGLVCRSLMLRRLPGIIRQGFGSLTAILFPPAAEAGSSSFDQIRSMAETHVDHFLQHTLPQEMPVIGMMVGEKTIAQLKAIS